MTEKKPSLFIGDLLHYNPAEHHDDSETVQGFAITHRQVSSMYTDGTIDTIPAQNNRADGSEVFE